MMNRLEAWGDTNIMDRIIMDTQHRQNIMDRFISDTNIMDKEVMDRIIMDTNIL